MIGSLANCHGVHSDGQIEKESLMKTAFKTLIGAAAIAGAATFAAAPANADGFGLSIGPGGGISFSVSSGGYCDQWGCPDDYWGYPVFYGPVYYGGSWYRGPLYYRYSGGSYWYWLHGGWRRDEWRGPRPGWARNYRYGPALSLDYYRSHGFRVRDAIGVVTAHGAAPTIGIAIIAIGAVGTIGATMAAIIASVAETIAMIEATIALVAATIAMMMTTTGLTAAIATIVAATTIIVTAALSSVVPTIVGRGTTAMLWAVTMSATIATFSKTIGQSARIAAN